MIHEPTKPVSQCKCSHLASPNRPVCSRFKAWAPNSEICTCDHPERCHLPAPSDFDKFGYPSGAGPQIANNLPAPPKPVMVSLPMDVAKRIVTGYFDHELDGGMSMRSDIDALAAAIESAKEKSK
jgi:hypothetical protein